MGEDHKEDFRPMLKEVSSEWRGIRFYIGDLRLWVIIGMLVTLVSNGVTIWLYYFEARPTAKAAYDNIRSREKLLDLREQGLNFRERRLRYDSVKLKRTRDTVETFLQMKNLYEKFYP